VPPLDFRAEGFSSPARAELARLGLLKGVWADRVESGGPALAAFINRFYRAAGFEHVVRAFFGGRLLRATARLAMRTAMRIAPGAWRRLSFEPALRPALGGGVAPGLALRRGRHIYLMLPWSRLDASTLRRQRRQDLQRYGSQASLRWVLDKRQFSQAPVELSRRIERRLDGAPPPIWLR
jgi:hypothetical protein